MNKLFALFSLPILFTQSLWAEPSTQEFDSKNLKSVEISNNSGKVRVGVSKTAKTLVTVDKVKFGDDCKFEATQADSTLLVRVVSKSLFSKGDCKVNLDLKVPETAALDINNGSGPVDIQNTKGDITFQVGSGDVSILSQVLNLNGKTGSGKIVVNGISGSAELRSGSGDVKVTYAKLPPKGELSVDSGSGDVELSFPKDSKILTSVRTGSGRTYNELGDNKDATFKVSVKSGSGDLNIKKQ